MGTGRRGLGNHGGRTPAGRVVTPQTRGLGAGGASHRPCGENKARRRRDHYPEELAEGEGWDAGATPWSGKIAVLVVDLPGAEWTDQAVCHCYRKRGDAENIIDEVKHQWGWGGFMTNDLGATSIMANFIAVVFNFWRLYTRLFDEHHNREAIVTRPMLMNGVGRQVSGGGQKRVKVSLMHESGDVLAQALEAISKAMSRMAAIAEQLAPRERWLVLLVRIYRAYFGGKRPLGYPPGPDLLLSG